MKKCTKCEIEKPLDEFGKHKGTKDGKRPSCKACTNAVNAGWRGKNPDYYGGYRAANKESIAGYKASWKRKNRGLVAAQRSRRRAKKACVVPQRWVKRQDVPESLCYWCGSEDIAHVEHLHPISLGGPAMASNEHMACVDCNQSKSDKHPLVWIAELVMEV